MAVKSMQEKFVNRLLAGRQLTTEQICKIGFANPRDAVYKARRAGLNVITNTTQVRGRNVTKYSLG